MANDPRFPYFPIISGRIIYTDRASFEAATKLKESEPLLCADVEIVFQPLDAETLFIRAWNAGKVRRVSDGKKSPDFK